MLDLQAGVHLEEIEFLALGIIDELDGAGGFIGNRGTKIDGRLVQAGAGCSGKAGGGGLLDHLLVSPLQRAVALAERDHLALAIAEDLHLDMPGLGYKTLDINARIAEACPCGALHAFEGRFQAFGITAKLHPDAAAAGRAFQHDGIADRLGRRECFIGARKQTGAGQKRHAARPGEFTRRMFQAEGREVLRPRADEGNAFGGKALGETDIFREEAIAWMCGLSACRLAGGDDRIDVEIAFAGRRGPRRTASSAIIAGLAKRSASE